MTHDFYRPAACHQMKGAVDPQGRPLAWSHTIASTSIEAYWHPDAGKPEDSEIGGAEQMPYAIPNVRLEYNHVASAVPPLWWRSVEHSFNGFAVECFIDELAAAAGRDPVQFRKTLLVKPDNWKPKSDEDPDRERLRTVMELAAEKAGWGTPLPKGQGRGIATYHSFGSYIAEVAEPVRAPPWIGVLDDHPRRHPFARPGGPAADLAWASAILAKRGLRPAAPRVADQ